MMLLDENTVPGNTADDEPATELTLTLRKPITLGTLTYEKLELTEPLAGDLIKAGKAGTDLEQLAELIRLNAKVPRGVVDQLLQRDLMAAAAFYAPFA